MPYFELGDARLTRLCLIIAYQLGFLRRPRTDPPRRYNALCPPSSVGRGAACQVLRVRSARTEHWRHRADILLFNSCFLYRSHLIICKIKKRDSYEPREWLPLRLFELTDVEDGDGALCSLQRLDLPADIP